MIRDHVLFSGGYYVAFDDAPLKFFAHAYFTDWDADAPTEMTVAREIFATLNKEQKKRLHGEISDFLQVERDDEALTGAWLELGAAGWLKKTSVTTFLKAVLLELDGATS